MRLPRIPVSLLVLTSALPAAAQDLPPRKVGLWDMKLTFERGHKPYAVKHCIDATTDLALSPLAYPVVYAPPPPGYPIVNRCSPLNVNRLGADLTVEWSCYLAAKQRPWRDQWQLRLPIYDRDDVAGKGRLSRPRHSHAERSGLCERPI